MIVIAKRFKTYVFLGVIMFPGRKSLSCPNEQLKPFFLKEQSCSQRESFFSPQNHGCSLGQLKSCPFENMVVPRGTT